MSQLATKPSVGFWLAVVPLAVMEGYFIWEMTWLSWEQGPQRVASLNVHSGEILVWFAGGLGILGWATTTFVMAVFSVGWRNVTNLAGAALAVAIILFSPSYGFWIRTFAGRIAHGPHATSFLLHAVNAGDIPTARALLDHGVPASEITRKELREITAPEMHELLVEHGAGAMR